MNEKLALDIFGQILIKTVRNEAIDDWNRISNGKMKDKESQEIFEALKSFKPEQIEFIVSLFPKIVDTTLHHLLWLLEQNEIINVMVKSDQDTLINIREVSDGLAGELYTEDGWISRFSSNSRSNGEP